MKQKTMNGMLQIGSWQFKTFVNAYMTTLSHLISSLFAQMLKSVGEYGRGLKPPTYHEVRVSYLKKALDDIQSSLETYKIECEEWGYTLIINGKGRSLTHFPVSSPSGKIFLEIVGTSDVIKDANQIFNLFDMKVEEFGKDNVVQVVTNGASNIVTA